MKSPSRIAAPRQSQTSKKMSRVFKAPPICPSFPSKKAGLTRALPPSQLKLPVPPGPRRTIHKVKHVDSSGAGKRAIQKKHTILEQKSVSCEVKQQYAGYLQRFVGFCKESGFHWPPASNLIDPLLTDYLDILYLDNRSCHEGEKTLAAVEFEMIQLKGQLVRARRALKGWRKEMPPQSRLPLPRLCMFGIAMQLFAQGFIDMSLKVVTDFFLYLRPGEGLDIKGRNVIPPSKAAGIQYRWVNVVIRDMEGGKPDKVGIYDNSIPLDLKHTKWIGDQLLRKAKMLSSPDSLIFTFSMEEFRVQFVKAASQMGLHQLHPYQLRHGGATEELTAKVREFNQVKSRGRWKTDKSVRRYAKIGRVQQLLAKMSKQGTRFCQWSEKNLEQVFRGTKAARKVTDF